MARRRRGVPAMLAQFDEQCSLLDQFGPRLKTLIEDVLAEAGVRVHSVTFRVKDRTDLEAKLSRPDKRYTSLDEVTDLLGARVITYFPDEVDQVATVISREFEIDWANSVDRRATLDPDTFGYLSLHYVAKVGLGRRDWLEYKRFAQCMFEVQMRSILQHAWAEIEHDLGYKTREAIPRELRRRFSRLAGLLEIADEEFRSIRRASETYASDVAVRVVDTPETTAVDQESLHAFLEINERVHELDAMAAAAYDEEVFEPDVGYAGMLSRNLSYFGIDNIADLDHAITERKETVSAFFRAFAAGREDDQEDRGDQEEDHGPLPRGVSVWHLMYVLAAERGADAVREYCSYAGFSEPDALAEDVLAAYRCVTSA